MARRKTLNQRVGLELKNGRFMTETKTVNIVDRPLSKGKNEVVLSTFSFLFSEFVQYTQLRVDSTQELEQRLSEAGYGIGLRILELIALREKGARKEKDVISMLQFIHGTVWKTLFGKFSDGLEKSTEKDDEYYIYDKEPLTNRFVSVPRTLGQLNCAAFIAGIINGVLDAAEFPCEVSAHWNADRSRTVYVVRFAKEVIQRPVQ